MDKKYKKTILKTYNFSLVSHYKDREGIWEAHIQVNSSSLSKNLYQSCHHKSNAKMETSQAIAHQILSPLRLNIQLFDFSDSHNNSPE